MTYVNHKAVFKQHTIPVKGFPKRWPGCKNEGEKNNLQSPDDEASPNLTASRMNVCHPPEGAVIAVSEARGVAGVLQVDRAVQDRATQDHNVTG